MAQEQQPGSLPVLVPVKKPISLIPVGIKEAALDSPTFRATAVHFSDQFEAVERWLDGLVKAAGKLAQEAASLEGLCNSFIHHCRPPNHLSEAILDHDYTILALRRLCEGAQDAWLKTLVGMKNTQSAIVDPIKVFLNNEIKPLKEARRQMHETRKDFDSQMSRFAGQAKTKEASSLREDAFQVHEARRSYLKASMDFCVLAPQVRQALDFLLIKLATDQWTEIKDMRQTSNNPFGKYGNEMSRIRSWCQEMAGGEKVLKRELLMARREIEESAEKAARPSRDLDDYAKSTVPSLGTGPSDTAQAPGSGPPAFSRQGWLYMRTLTGKPTRVMWVRRWFFVKNGIFGWLVQGSRSGGVEESEKIGVLLCGIRPAAQEERRFCFEVKTKDSSIILQAENQSDLSEWISVFSAAKQKAVDEPGTNDLLASSSNPTGDAAFAVSPPLSAELAAKRPDGQVASISEDNQGSLLSAEGEPGGGPTTRASFDVSAARKPVAEEGSRDHAARILQKLDIHRKSNASPQVTGGTISAPTIGGGISSLIAASHTAMPVGPSAAQKSQPKNEQARFSASMAPPTLINTPSQTNLTRVALTVGVERGCDLGVVDATGGVPSGLMANLWGSANHGHLSRLDRGEVNYQRDQRSAVPTPSPNNQSRRSSDPSAPVEAKVSTSNLLAQTSNNLPKSPSREGSPPRHRKTISAADDVRRGRSPGGFSEFPSFYPPALRAHDAQFRMLFPNVPADERVVMVFRASWSPEEQNDLPGRAFVTPNDIFFYGHHLGMVMVTSASLESILDVTVEASSSHDFIVLHIAGRNGRQDSTIALKTFLEHPSLLQRRLNFLIANATSEDDVPLGLDAVLQNLVNLEKNKPSQGLDDLGTSSLTRQDTMSSRNDDRMRLRVDRNIFGGDGSSAPFDGNDPVKFRLPTQPVNYTPLNVTTLAAEKVLEVSAKALLHIMFGDKSALCSTTYQERRARSIKQQPWTKLDEENHCIRNFEYEIEVLDNFHRTRKANVTDTQSIDVYNDHLCYMITDVKIPWHLPHPTSYRLISKIVITHEAKLRSKLAIFSKIEWLQHPWFIQPVLERRALEDLRLDALNTLSLASDQVGRLGQPCNTRRAIDIFGHIGVQTAPSLFHSTDPSLLGGHFRTQIRRQTLIGLLLESFLSFGVSATSTVLMSAMGLTRSLVKGLSLHLLLILLLASSIATNLWTGSEGAANYFHDKRIAGFMSRLGVGPNFAMSRAVYLRDLPDTFSSTTFNFTASAFSPYDSNPGHDSKCAHTFQTMLTHTDLDAPSLLHRGHHASSHAEAATSATARRLQRMRHRLGIYRGDLLVALRLVNRIEAESVQAEWENWVLDENAKCAKTTNLLYRRRPGDNESDSTRHLAETLGAEGARELVRWHEEYCASCTAESRTLADVI